MQKVWIIAKHEFITNVRRKGFIIWTLTVPLLGLLGVAIAAFAGGAAADLLEATFIPEEQVVGLVDDSGLFMPIHPDYAETFIPYADEAAGREAVSEGDIGALLVVPADYMDEPDVTVITREGGFNIGVLEQAEDYFRDVLLESSTEPDLTTRLLNPIDPINVALDSEAEEGAEGGGVADEILGLMVPYFLGILLVTSIFTASGYLLRGVAEEKANRIIEIILSSVRAWELLAGKVIGLGALGLAQITFWLACSAAISGGLLPLVGVLLPALANPASFLLNIVYYLLGFMVYAVLMASGGALGSTEQESQQIAGIFSMMAAIPLMLGGFMFTNPNMMLARVLSYIPFTAPTMMMLRTALGEVPVIDIIMSLLITAASIPFIVWLGAKVFRTGLLMYGKKPSLKEVWAIMRAA